MDNETTIWNFLTRQGLTDCGVAGLMGNLYAESLFNPKNLETVYEKKLGFSDDSYTKAVDSGAYKNFTKDSAGYGLAQWTYGPRKRNLLEYAKSLGASVGDLNMQLNFLVKELTSPEYISLWNSLLSARSIYDATVEVMVRYERPANVSSSAKNGRYNYSKAIYDRHHNKKDDNYPALPVSPVQEHIDYLAQSVIDGKWSPDWERAVVSSISESIDRLKTNSKNASRKYTVVRGDTLTKIAREYNTDVDSIVQRNKNTYPSITRDNINVGWVLEI
jgi:hypothetical protein